MSSNPQNILFTTDFLYKAKYKQKLSCGLGDFSGSTHNLPLER